MKASEINKGLEINDSSAPDDRERTYYIHPNRIPVYKAYAEVDAWFDRSIHDRVWHWWITIVTGDRIKQQEITKEIPQVYRIKDSKGEWLFYNVNLYGRSWEGNRKDFSYVEGRIEGMPEWEKQIDPATGKIIPGTTPQMFDTHTIYTIKFTKDKVDELHQYFKTPLSCIVIAEDGRKYSCTLSEFRDMPYEALVNDKTGFTEWTRQKRGLKTYS
jgi:hypothetical protein